MNKPLNVATFECLYYAAKYVFYSYSVKKTAKKFIIARLMMRVQFIKINKLFTCLQEMMKVHKTTVRSNYGS